MSREVTIDNFSSSEIASLLGQSLSKFFMAGNKSLSHFCRKLLLLSAPAYADITSKFTSSVSVKVDAAMPQAPRIGASYSASGRNIGSQWVCDPGLLAALVPVTGVQARAAEA